jgi:signal transduction histidine kinase
VQFSFDVYWETDAQHRFTHQEFAESLADAPAPGSEIGKTRWEVPYLEPDEEAWRKHRETLDAHLPFRDFELARAGPDGSKRYVSVSGLPVFDETGRFVGYRGVGRHITERRRAEEALRAAQAELAHANRITAMGQLSASIAHEVNQPIAATVMVQGDRTQLQQVILNLILNAIEAMGELDDGNRELSISTEPEAAAGVLVTVRDSGPGLDPVDIERVFQAFYTTKAKGMGMGLAICRSMVEAHGGRMWASRNEPRGAVFQFTLPLQQDESVPAQQLRPNPAA